MLALLPVLLSHKFKRIEEKGPLMWMEYMQVCSCVFRF